MLFRTNFWDDKRVVSRSCPNAGNACNCIGACQPLIVSKDDPRTDDEIRADAKKEATWMNSSQSIL